MTQPIDILKAVIAAWKRKDIEAVLLHMDDDIVWHFAAAAMPPVEGKAAARRFLQRFGADMTDIDWRIVAYAEAGDRLFVEGIDDYVTADGRRVVSPYAGVLDFRGDRIVAWRDYVDLGVVAAQKAGEPISPQVHQLLARAPAS